jgi:tetratricopeptide (TPR) repeat protein
MIAIAEKDPQSQIRWNLKGIEIANADTNSRGWLHALYNNIGESYLKIEDYDNACLYFHKLIELQTENGGEPDMYTLKDEARAMRLSGKPDEAIVLIEPICVKLRAQGRDDGWNSEEMAENLYALGRLPEAKPHFKKAYELLAMDVFCIRNEQEKLLHLREMAK